MLLRDLLNVMEGDTKIHVELSHREMYNGRAGSVDLPEELLNVSVKGIWYSTLYNAIWIDI